MTIVDGKIQYVGSVKSAKALCDDKTEVFYYSDKYIYPGFLEAHCHTMFAGYRSIGQASVANVMPTDAAKFTEIIKKFIDENPDKEIYLAAGWAEDGNPEINSALLDKICPDKPLILNTSGGHSLIINTKGKEHFGINKEYAKKWEEGLVRVDENGEPTGYLCEAPCLSIIACMDIAVAEAKDYLLDWQKFAFKNGFTGVADAGTELIHKNAATAHEELQSEDKLKLRTYAYMLVKDNIDDPKGRIEEFAKYAKEKSGEYYKVVGAKIFLDGVLEAHTSWLTKEYKDQAINKYIAINTIQCTCIIC